MIKCLIHPIEIFIFLTQKSSFSFSVPSLDLLVFVFAKWLWSVQGHHIFIVLIRVERNKCKFRSKWRMILINRNL